MLTKVLPIRLLLAMSALVLIIGTMVAACKKTGITIPPSQADFLDQTSGVYFITGPDVIDSIPIGVTTVSDKDRIVSFAVSSNSAVAGTAYTLAADSVVIPAGQALGYIVVKGNYTFYNGSIRKDTLVITFEYSPTGGIAPSDFNDTFTLVMRGPCVEGEDFDPAEFNGVYSNSIDGQGGYLSGAYPVTISSTSTGPTSATLVIQNLGNQFFGPFDPSDPVLNPGITVDLDWSDPLNLTATVPSQPYINAAFTATLAGDPGGTFSSCHQTFTLNYDVLIPAYFFDSGPVTTTIAR